MEPLRPMPWHFSFILFCQRCFKKCSPSHLISLARPCFCFHKISILKFKLNVNPLSSLAAWDQHSKAKSSKWGHLNVARVTSWNKHEHFLVKGGKELKVGQSLYILWRPQNFGKSSPYFWLALHRTKVRWGFRKILWPSQNIWTLLKPWCVRIFWH